LKKELLLFTKSNTEVQKPIKIKFIKNNPFDGFDKLTAGRLRASKGAVNIWLVVLVVVVAAIAGYFVFKNSGTPKTDQPQNENQVTATNETADWQTYRNEKYGFEFKYPNKVEDYDFVVRIISNNKRG